MSTLATSRNHFALYQYMLSTLFSLLCLSLWPSLLKAETVYLAPIGGFSTFLAEDELRSYPDLTGAPSVQKLPVWSPLEVLERVPADGLRSDFWLKVKTKAGEVGWTLSDYVLLERPDMGAVQILSDPSGNVVELLPRSETPKSHMRGLIQEVASGTEAYLVMKKPPYWNLVRTVGGQAGWVYDRQLVALAEYQEALGQTVDEQGNRPDLYTLSDAMNSVVELYPQAETPKSYDRSLVIEVPVGTEAHLIAKQSPYWSFVETTTGDSGWVYDRNLRNSDERQDLADQTDPGDDRSTTRFTAALMGSDGFLELELYDDDSSVAASRIISFIDQNKFERILFFGFESGFSISTGDVEFGYYDYPVLEKIGSGKSYMDDLPMEPSASSFKRGDLFMNRGSDLNSSNIQFSILLADAPYLDGKYIKIGKVLSGLDDLLSISDFSRKVSSGLVGIDYIVRQSAVERLGGIERLEGIYALSSAGSALNEIILAENPDNIFRASSGEEMAFYIEMLPENYDFVFAMLSTEQLEFFSSLKLAVTLFEKFIEGDQGSLYMFMDSGHEAFERLIPSEESGWCEFSKAVMNEAKIRGSHVVKNLHVDYPAFANYASGCQ